MASKIATIQTSDGDVHTGKVVDVNTHVGIDMLSLVFTGGLAALSSPSEPTYTVEHNGERYSGRKI